MAKRASQAQGHRNSEVQYVRPRPFWCGLFARLAHFVGGPLAAQTVTEHCITYVRHTHHVSKHSQMVAVRSGMLLLQMPRLLLLLLLAANPVLLPLLRLEPFYLGLSNHRRPPLFRFWQVPGKRDLYIEQKRPMSDLEIAEI